MAWPRGSSPVFPTVAEGPKDVRESEERGAGRCRPAVVHSAPHQSVKNDAAEGYLSLDGDAVHQKGFRVSIRVQSCRGSLGHNRRAQYVL